MNQRAAIEHVMAFKYECWKRWTRTRVMGEYILWDELFLDQDWQPRVTMTKKEFERAMK